MLVNDLQLSVFSCLPLCLLLSVNTFFCSPLAFIMLAIPQTAELIRALQELENAASSDSVLRQRISSLPAEVQDTSLLHRITGKEALRTL